METKGQTWQDVNEAALPVLGQPERSPLDSIFAAIQKRVNVPVRLFASFPTPDARLNFEPSRIEDADGAGRVAPPIGTTTPDSPLTYIDFQAQTFGPNVSITFPASTVGQFRRCAFTLDNTGTIIAAFSAEAASVGALVDPATLFVPGGQPKGWVDLECTNVAGMFKTAGSVTNIIENKVGSTSRIFRIDGGGGGGGGGASIAGIAQTVSIGLGQDTINVVFPFALPSAVYVPQVQLKNVLDANPAFFDAQVVAQTQNGMTVKLNAPTDTANYLLLYKIPVLQEQAGDVSVPNGVDELEVPLPITLSGALYTVIAQLKNVVDAAPQFQSTCVVQQANDKFKAKWNVPTDSGNYRLTFQVAEFT